MRSEIQCPVCPICSAPPVLPWSTLTPWFCSNAQCITFAWDPFSTLDENLTDVGKLPPAAVGDGAGGA